MMKEIKKWLLFGLILSIGILPMIPLIDSHHQERVDFLRERTLNPNIINPFESGGLSSQSSSSTMGASSSSSIEPLNITETALLLEDPKSILIRATVTIIPQTPQTRTG